LLDRLDSLKARIDALRPFSAAVEKKIDLALEARFVASSNLIEDKEALTLSETEIYLESALTSAGRRVGDFIALGHHREALAEVRAKARAGAPLTVDLIRGLHATLTRDLKGHDHGPGEWKTNSNRGTTQRGRHLRYAAPEAVPDLMRDLVALHESIAANAHPVQALATFSYHFHLIQPFNDSNGRVQRLVSSFLLLKAGFCELVVDPAERNAFLAALAACDATVPRDRLAPLYPGIVTRALEDFFGDCLERTLEDVVGIAEERVPVTTADVATASARAQNEFLVRLREASPGFAWRDAAAAEVRALHERVSATLKAGCLAGPLYSIECVSSDVKADHYVDPLIRAFIPAGGAGVIGQTVVAIRPKSNAGVKMPVAQRFVLVVMGSKVGMHLISRWEDEPRAVLRHGRSKSSEWSQASLEQHAIDRLERSRLAYDAEIVEVNRSKEQKDVLRAVTGRYPRTEVKGIQASEPPVDL
jgi:hypothetical protein